MGKKSVSTSSSPVVFVDGCRTPFLRAGTGYRDLRSYDLARLALRALLARNALDPASLDHVILGTVLANPANSNLARDAALGAGIPAGVPAFTVSQACISANLSITAGAQLISRGEAELVVAGGAECLSDLPIRYPKRFQKKLLQAQKRKGVLQTIRFILGLRPSDFYPEVPGITEFSTGLSMGEDADRLAARWKVSRVQQDEYALASHLRASAAREAGRFDDQVEPIRLPPDFEPILQDNGVRGDTSLEKLEKLPPAFVKPYGTITAGNASFLTDGAAAVLLASEEAAKRERLPIRARIVDSVSTAQDPETGLLMGPALAVSRLLQRNSLRMSDIDAFEFHEAFAGQVLANLKALADEEFLRRAVGDARTAGEIPADRLNRWGGSLSIGHPFGATGARLVSTAVHRLESEGGRLAVAASCAAGGLGNAILIEKEAEEG